MRAHCFSDIQHPAVSRWGRLLLASACLAGWPALSPAGTITTNRPVFFIPFVTDTRVAGGPPPVAVRLYVSGDQGATWHFYQRQLPDAGRFSFRAGVDGEFWFAVQTVAAGEDPAQPAEFEPEIRVIVDTRPPHLELFTTRAANGQIQADWAMAQADADASTFRLERSRTPEGPWQIVDTTAGQLPPSGGSFRGRATWPAGNLETVHLRATVSDPAGNESVVERRLSLQFGKTGEHSAEDPFHNVAENAGDPIGTVNRPFATGSRTTPRATPWTATTAPVAPVPHQDDAEGWYSADRNDIQRLPAAEDTQQLVSNSPANLRQFPTTGYRPFAGFDPNRDGAVSKRTPPANSSNPTVGGPAGPEEIRWSNSRRFELDYEIDSGALNVHRVEVWYTRDRGRSWQHHGDDPDRHSPYLVNVSEDGLCGFRLIIQSREGFAVQPPRAGDVPDAWIQVDATAPTGRITAARYGLGTELGTLQIEWEAEDAALAEKPIGLFFADNPDGPWRKIADQLPHSGGYEWKVDDRVPRTIYLRLEVRDRAGNVHASVLADPISNEGLAPRGHIRDIRPADRRGGFAPTPAPR